MSSGPFQTAVGDGRWDGIGTLHNTTEIVPGSRRGKGKWTSMDASELLRLVDAIHRDKNIDKEIVFLGIEAALVSACKKRFGEEADVVVTIDRASGGITGTHNGVPLAPAEPGAPGRSRRFARLVYNE